MTPALKSAERAEKIAAAKRGKPRPAGAIEKLRQANIGRKASDEARAKMSAARKGTIPPAIRGPVWTDVEHAMLGTMLDAELAARIGRSLSAVQSRRYQFKIEAFRP